MRDEASRSGSMALSTTTLCRRRRRRAEQMRILPSRVACHFVLFFSTRLL
jgi:hypothetical protein